MAVTAAAAAAALGAQLVEMAALAVEAVLAPVGKEVMVALEAEAEEARLAAPVDMAVEMQ
jgi:hypothetical protein